MNADPTLKPSDLPDLDTPYTINSDVRARFDADGHVLLRGVAAPEKVTVFRSAILEAVGRFNTESRPLEERDVYGRAFLQIMNLWQKDERVRRFVLSRCFARIAAELMGVDAVRLYHDQALFKEPGGGPTPWHQDQNYWPLDTDKTVTMWMPLVDIPEAVGTMSFVSGTHRSGHLGQLPISETSESEFERYIRENALEPKTYGAMEAGDATFHAGWTLHGAPGNPGAAVREVMTIIYFADGAKVREPDSRERANDLRDWLPGVRPGEPAASVLNPVLYRAGER